MDWIPWKNNKIQPRRMNLVLVDRLPMSTIRIAVLLHKEMRQILLLPVIPQFEIVVFPSDMCLSSVVDSLNCIIRASTHVMYA